MLPVRIKIPAFRSQLDLLRSTVDPLDPDTYAREGDGVPRRPISARDLARDPAANRRRLGAASRVNLEDLLAFTLLGFDVPKPEREFAFHPTRKWRFDFAWPALKIAAEVQGGIWNRGAHGRGSGIERDAEKLNEAQLLGWVVLLLSPGQVRTGIAAAWLERAVRMRLAERAQPQPVVCGRK